MNVCPHHLWAGAPHHPWTGGHLPWAMIAEMTLTETCMDHEPSVTCTEVDGKCSLLVEDPLPDAVHHAATPVLPVTCPPDAFRCEVEADSDVCMHR